MLPLHPSAALLLAVSGGCHLGLLAIAAYPQAANAQVVPNPNDTQTQVTQTGNQIQIDGGVRSGDGQNLFHSFSQFDVPGSNTAVFVVGSDINTVLGRITNGNPSIIDGQVLVTGSDTNLILMNPAGMLFGPNSSVSVPGSFTATTASGVQFGEQWWNGVGLNNYGALNGSPTSFVFTSPQPGALVSSGSIVAGGDVLLTGGVTAVTGTISAPAGAIVIASVQGGQQITLSAPGSPLSLNITSLPAGPGATPNALPFQPRDLPSLLTGRSDTTAIGLIPNSDGSVTLVARNTRLDTPLGTTVVSGELDAGAGVAILGDRVVDTRAVRRMGNCDPAVQNCDDPPPGGGGGNNPPPPDNGGGGNDPPPPDNGGGGNDPNNPPPDNGDGGNDPNNPPPDNGGGGNDPNNPPPDNGGGGNDPNNPPPDNGGGGNDPNNPPPDSGEMPPTVSGEPPTDPNAPPDAGRMPPGGEPMAGPAGGPADEPELPDGPEPLENRPDNGPGAGGIEPVIGAGPMDMNGMDDRDEMEGGPEPMNGEPQMGPPMDGDPMMMALPPDLEGNQSLEALDGEVLARLNGEGQPEMVVLRAIAGAEGDFDESLSAAEGPEGLGEGPAFANVGLERGDFDGGGGDGAVLALDDPAGLDPREFGRADPEFDGPGGPLAEVPPPLEDAGLVGRDGDLGDIDTDDGSVGDRRSLSGEGGLDGETFIDDGAIALQGRGLDSGDLAALNAGDWLIGDDASSAFGSGEIDSGISIVEQAWDRQFDSYGLDQTAVQTLSSTSIRDNLSVIADQTGDRSALVYIMLQPTGLELVMIGPEGNPIFRRIRGISREEVLKTAFQLRETITNPVLRRSNVYQQPARKLYDWIVQPLLEELDGQNISTLLFAPDAGLRSLPFAALYDGEQFLVERFSLGVTPSINLTDTKYVDLRSAPVIAMGASEFSEGLSPLPAVPVELESIAGTERRTEILLNDEFTVEQLRAVRDRNPAPIIHLATHGEFQSGALDNSFIQFWGDERLTLDRLRELQFNSPQVELLILSACRTAVGDPNAELGFAGVSVHAGVKSTLASVWYVADAGTLALMDQFYDALGEESTKSQSLRQAQLALLRGEVRLEAGALRTRGKQQAINLPAASLELLGSGTDLSHPYYWAGFTLIGSPW